jgi:RHS repeat-associated protein
MMYRNDDNPFGMLQPERQFNAGIFRYGFNGKENDNEVKGLGNWQDYGMRFYDPRIGRFPNVDQLTKKYPELTPFQFASNNPIQNIDLDGLEGVPPGESEPEKDLEYENLNEREAKEKLAEPAKPSEEEIERLKNPITRTEDIKKFLEPKEIDPLNKALSKGIAEIEIGKVPRTFSSINTGTTNEIRTTEVLGIRFQINSGHGYNRPHTTGSFSNTPLSMNDVENGIVNDIITNISLPSIPETTNPNYNNKPLIQLVNINNVQVGYSVVQTNGVINISTYYPK